MAIWLKRLLFGIIGLVSLLLIAVIALIFLINPNDWKPQLEKLAQKQGYALHITGDIEWQLFPSLALSIGRTSLSVASATIDNSASLAPSNIPLVSTNKIIAQVALKPLLDRQIRIEKISLDTPAIYLHTDKNGVTNYSAPNKTGANKTEVGKTEAGKTQTDNTNTQKTTSPAAESDVPLDIAINSIVITDGDFILDDETSAQKIQAKSLQLQADNVKNNGEQSPLSLSLTLLTKELKNPIDIKIGGDISLNQSKQIASLSGGDIELILTNEKISTSLNLTANYKDNLSINGDLKTSSINLQHLLDALGQEKIITANPTALSALSLTTSFSVEQNASKDSVITLKPLNFSLDKSTGKGDLTLQLAAEDKPIQINTTLAINSINIDDYLAPAEETKSTANASSNPAAIDSPLPLDFLRSTNLTANFSIGDIVVSGLQASNFSTAINARNGLWKLPNIRADFYQGKFSGNTTIDAHAVNKPANIDFIGTLNGVSLLPLLTNLADLKDLDGKANIDITAKTSALTSNQLMDNLNASVTFDSNAIRLQGFNVEEYYCKAAQQLGSAEPTPSKWPTFSDITSIKGTFLFANNIVNIKSLTANAVNIGVTSAGKFNLLTQAFKFRVPLRLLQAENSPAGCIISSNFLKTHEIDVVQCKGNLDNLDLAKVCAIDTSSIATLAKQAIRYNAEKKIDVKKKEVRQELKDKLLEKLDSKDTKEGDPAASTDTTKKDKPSTRDLLKDLLKK